MPERLSCPHCRAAYPTWRVIVRIGSPVCPSCRAALSFSKESAQRLLGAVGGAALFAALMLAALFFGADMVWTVGFWALFLPACYLLGRILLAFVGRLRSL